MCKIIALYLHSSVWSEMNMLFIATKILIKIILLWRHHCDVIFFSDVIRCHVTFQTIFSDVIRRHHSFVYREKYNIYIDAWKQKILCIKNNTIFTQMLENNRPFVRKKEFFVQVSKLLPCRSFSTTFLHSILLI